ncbi:MAG: UDP-N-acetylglucosamine--N-acetylmuramyl-(pentapeptide) pyrophosphoryl-undecaprenol N-acetylglucosamine transferase [Planctomycetes bacterium]|nr:UDP-N-acetylglucosamine--N-acetylmuramyl-(pentapeptide) pyrophosphoryl-undecaprenol N-acetylglucosamine transferase [Planctomycetota bacterium]
MVRRVCLVSGGTGGHLMPALVLGEALRERGHDTVFLAEGRGVETELLRRHAQQAEALPVGRRDLLFPLRMARCIGTARRYLRAHGVEMVVATGGAASLAAGLAARSLGVPLVLLEQNVHPGAANRWLAPWAERTYLGLPSPAPRARSLYTGTPVRRDIRDVDRGAARRSLGLCADVPVVLVTGGSQGAEHLNVTVPAALSALRRPLQVLHLAGPGQEDAVRSRYAAGEPHGLQALVRPMVADMGTLYGAADLVVCRGGGGTVAELMAAGRAAILVPYPHHRDRQQYHNGMVLEEAGAGIVIEERRATATALAGIAETLLRRPHDLLLMGRKARALYPEDVCGRILGDLAKVVNLN